MGTGNATALRATFVIGSVHGPPIVAVPGERTATMQATPLDASLPRGGIKRYFVSQFGNPRGLVGSLVGHAMALKNRRRIEWALRQLAPGPSDHVLEIGFGPGVSLQRLFRLLPQGFLAGVELSPLMLTQARRRLASEIASSRLDLKQAGVSSLPYEEGRFHQVLAINTHMFWPRPLEDFKEVKRVLAAGGRLLVVVQPHGARDEAVVKQVANKIEAQMGVAGFREITTCFEPMRPVTCIAVHGRKP